MFALIFENKVVEISSEQFPVAGNLMWIECQSNVKVGWHYVDAQFKEDIRTTTQKKEDLKITLISSRKKYLQDSDFKVLRFIEEGTDYSTVKAKRTQARQEINEIEACTTLSQLNEFSENF